MASLLNIKKPYQMNLLDSQLLKRLNIFSTAYDEARVNRLITIIVNQKLTIIIQRQNKLLFLNQKSIHFPLIFTKQTKSRLQWLDFVGININQLFTSQLIV